MTVNSSNSFYLKLHLKEITLDLVVADLIK